MYLINILFINNHIRDCPYAKINVFFQLFLISLTELGDYTLSYDAEYWVCLAGLLFSGDVQTLCQWYGFNCQRRLGFYDQGSRCNLGNVS